MARGIIVFGASGSGTTTLGKELARSLGFQHFDLDDYYWLWDTEVPFTVARPLEERIKKLMSDLENCPFFVMSGSLGMWSESFIPLFDLAVFVTAPAAVRVERLHSRELTRFGERILAGGDMADEHRRFLDWAGRYDAMEPPERCLTLHEQWITTLSCPVLRLDGTVAILENTKRIMEHYAPILPVDLAAMLDGYTCEKNRVGCSSAGVYRYHTSTETLYLKITCADEESRRDYGLLCWLAGKLPVPEIKYRHEQDGLAYLLMTEVPGHMACDCPEDTVAKPVETTVKLLADGLLMLQAVDIQDCPFDNTLDRKLAWALDNIHKGLVDMNDWETDTPFETPLDLHRWLTANRPPEDVTFTHGDYCLPNVFIDGAAVTGFIDVSRGGLSDRWQDIALCVRSLRYNLRDMEHAERDRFISLLFSRLAVKPDWGKIEYYILLDELF